MDLKVELEQFVGLISFLIKFGCYYIPTIIGAIVSFCTKTSKVKRKKKGVFRSFLIQVFAFSITPAFLITSICSLLATNIGDSTIIYGIAFVCGAVGEDITQVFTSLKRINRVTSSVSESVQCLKGVAAMTGAMLPDEDKPNLPVNTPVENTDEEVPNEIAQEEEFVDNFEDG